MPRNKKTAADPPIEKVSIALHRNVLADIPWAVSEHIRRRKAIELTPQQAKWNQREHIDWLLSVSRECTRKAAETDINENRVTVTAGRSGWIRLVSFLECYSKHFAAKCVIEGVSAAEFGREKPSPYDADAIRSEVERLKAEGEI